MMINRFISHVEGKNHRGNVLMLTFFYKKLIARLYLHVCDPILYQKGDETTMILE